MTSAPASLNRHAQTTHRPAERCPGGRRPRRRWPGSGRRALAPAAAADTTPGYSVTPITVPVKVGPNNDQACTIDADLYVPDGTSTSRKVPAILSTHGFGGTRPATTRPPSARVSSARATRCSATPASASARHLQDPPRRPGLGREGRQADGRRARGQEGLLPVRLGTGRYLRTIATEGAGDPRVGMIGGSYGGQIQYAVAKQDARIDAIIPIITWNDLNYSLAPGRVAEEAVGRPVLRARHRLRRGATRTRTPRR